MRIADAFGPGRPPVISFEFFPPKTPEAEARLFETVARLGTALQRDFEVALELFQPLWREQYRFIQIHLPT